MLCVVLFFFFQAEDGIRDGTVTGVQTCALPISSARFIAPARRISSPSPMSRSMSPRASSCRSSVRRAARSEERRVGKECRSRGSPYHEKKKRGVRWCAHHVWVERDHSLAGDRSL